MQVNKNHWYGMKCIKSSIMGQGDSADVVYEPFNENVL
jgi:hypothetical protein